MKSDGLNPLRHLTADELLDLVLGLAAKAARRGFVEHIAGCASCEARLREVAATHERARALQATMLNGAGHAEARAGAGRSLRQPSRFAVVSLALAAALTVVAGLFVMLRLPLQPMTRPPAAVAWLPRPELGMLTRGGDSNGADTTLIAGLVAYELHDLLGARELLESSHATGMMEQVRRVYLANTLLHLGAVKPALEQLQSLDYTELPEPWRSESRWALGSALARTGNTRQADSLLRQLATEPGPIGARARAGLLKPAR